ncbi:MAG: hypothetical protein U1B30_05945, partial [Pseudomonadota bacterium]|nr:hypothetical protein [Pseudomonadota bacterium]
MKNKHYIPSVFSLLIGFSISVFFVVVLAPSAHAFTLYWVGADGASTSTASNWKMTNPSGCGGGDSISPPNTSDDVVFDADCDNNAVIDGVFSVNTFTMSSGYTGTVTQSVAVTTANLSGHSAQAGGTFSGGSAAITIGGNFSITGGTFTSTSGTLSLAGTYSRTSGTFAHNNGTVTFNGGTSSQTLTGETFYNLTINNTAPTPGDTDDVDPSAAI